MPLQLISISLPKLFTGKKCPYPQTQYPVKRFSTIFLREKQRFADYGQGGKNKGPLNREDLYIEHLEQVPCWRQIYQLER